MFVEKLVRGRTWWYFILFYLQEATIYPFAVATGSAKRCVAGYRDSFLVCLFFASPAFHSLIGLLCGPFVSLLQRGLFVPSTNMFG